MILLFPDRDTFRLAVTAGVVPPDAALAPTTAAADAAGRLSVSTDAKLSKKTKDELDKLGVVGTKRHVGDPIELTSWLQAIPLQPEAAPPQVANTAAVLFELPDAGQMPAVVGEMLRLGNDRQGFRWLTSASGDKRVLLRVIGPPYYTLLRAFDRLAGQLPIRAFTERAPRVWVELGQSHPLAHQIQPGDGQLVLLRAPLDWEFLPDSPFQDVYDILKYDLPAGPTAWTETAVADRITVPLRLVPGNAADVAELWVVRGDAVQRLDALVRDSDDRLTEQLTFAVATSPAGEQVAVLRTRPSKKQPPVLELEGAVGYRPYWRLPNLFLPAGTRLHPTVRRDVVAKLLADDPDTLVWLSPAGDGTFVPDSLPEDSFRPLPDWVEYVIDANREPLAAWVAASTFEFESFTCADAGGPKPKGPDKPTREPKGRGDAEDAAPTKTAPKPSKKPDAEPAGPAFVAPLPEARPPSEWRLRCDALEKEFAAVDGPLDAPERVALWPQLAEANAGMGEDRRGEAAVCWANAMWDRPTPPAEWVAGWFRTEVPAGKFPVTAAEFDARMKPTNPTPSEARAFLVSLLAAGHHTPTPEWLKSRLPAAQKYLEAFEEKLPIRGVWLAAARLAQLSGGDVLGLARVRDRLLARLLERGLNPELDLPGFLRYAGLKDSERVRVVREKVVEVHRAAREWAEKSLKPAGAGQTPADTKNTLAYLDLLFAYGLAKLGEATPAKALVESGKAAGSTGDPGEQAAGKWLAAAFGYRVAQAAGDKPAGAMLPPNLIEELDALDKKGNQDTNNPYKLAHYAVARMREQSRVLEPQEKLDPYAKWMKHSDDLKRELAELPNEKDAARLGRRIRDLLKEVSKGKATAEDRLNALHVTLPLAARVGQELTTELIGQVPAVLKAVASAGPAAAADLPKKQGQLLERAMFLAAHFDKTDVVQQLVDQFIDYVRGRPDEQRFELVNVVAGQCLRSLRKVGLRDEIDKLLRRMQDEILKGRTLAQLKTQYATKPDVWSDVLQTMLNLAAGWLTFGLADQATGILDAARAEVFTVGSKIGIAKFVKLCQTYAAALGQGPADFGVPRLIELFRRLDPGKVTNTWTTARYYSRYHLNLIEEVVLAVVSDDFALGQAGRRWLDEDEHLVRRRVHREMKQLVDASRLS